jgi:hypothetical protein
VRICTSEKRVLSFSLGNTSPDPETSQKAMIGTKLKGIYERLAKESRVRR